MPPHAANNFFMVFIVCDHVSLGLARTVAIHKEEEGEENTTAALLMQMEWLQARSSYTSSWQLWQLVGLS